MLLNGNNGNMKAHFSINYMYTASLAIPKFNMITRSREGLPVTHRCW